MPVQALSPESSLQFYPLYWVHHGSWSWVTASNIRLYHWGHVHFFMLGYDPGEEGLKHAWAGNQEFRFEIKDHWGPRSGDPNQMTPYRVVGTPKWYWHVRELWRRVYIQPWDEQVKRPDGQVVGRRGVRWDACPTACQLGPFREGGRHCPVYIEGPRTLPLEYFHSEGRRQDERDWHLADLAEDEIAAWNAHPELGGRGGAFARTYTPSAWGRDDTRPRVESFPDGAYIHPTLEYQTVTRLDWERMPGWEAAHDHDDEHFGDGWSNSISLPLVDPVVGQLQTPFAPAGQPCRPFGEYFGTTAAGDPLVPLAHRPRHRKRVGRGVGTHQLAENSYDFAAEPFGLPNFGDGTYAWQDGDGQWVTGQIDDPREDLSEQPMQFHNPYADRTSPDGTWVAQFLGGLVQVRAVVTLEHRLGGRTEVTVTQNQLMPQEPFRGPDLPPA